MYLLGIDNSDVIGQECGVHLKSPDCLMIICHCQRITDTDIHGAIDWMREADGSAIITPRKVYRALGKTPDCGSCMPLFLSTMRSNDKLGVPQILRDMRGSTATA